MIYSCKKSRLAQLRIPVSSRQYYSKRIVVLLVVVIASAPVVVTLLFWLETVVMKNYIGCSFDPDDSTSEDIVYRTDYTFFRVLLDFTAVCTEIPLLLLPF